MKITKLETFTKSYVSFVKITIEDGEFKNFSIDKDKKTFINL